MKKITKINNPQLYQTIIDCDKKWAAANKLMNSASMVTLYHKNAVLWGTLATSVCTNHTQIKKYFTFLFGAGRTNLTVNFKKMQLHEDAGLVFNNGNYVFSWIVNNEPVSVTARFTFVYKKTEEVYKIIQHHSSIMPQ